MTDHELFKMALDMILAAIKSGDWKVDGACDPDIVIEALRARIEQSEPEPVKCIVKDCLNHQHEGKFAGDLCSPCHTFITTNEGKYSQAYRNTRREWVGLTDEELIQIGVATGLERAAAMMITNKLKEKNGG